MAREKTHILFYISLAFSTVIFIFSLATNLGISSLILDPIAAFLTVVHHVTILCLSRPQGKSDMTSLPYTYTSSLGCIICAWLLGLLWTAGAAILGIETTYFFVDVGTIRDEAVSVIELLLVVMEGVLVFTIAVLCTKHRRFARRDKPGAVRNIT